jgi:DNA-binding transcriptional MocR family regulator
MFSLDRNSPVALADQIEARLRELVARGQLPAGARLTSIRQLAGELAVSPNTVISAYDRLVAAGVIDACGTAGYFVNPRQGAMPEEVALEAGEEQEPVWLAQQANDQRAGVLLASSGALPPAWLEDAVPAAAVQRALARSVAGMASRCPPQGMPELRERIAMMLRGMGIPVDAGRILTTYGGTHAIDLICRSFLKPGDAVLVEDPGYFLMFGRLQQEGIRGWGSSAANLHKLLVLAQQYGFLIAEDDVQGHFHPGQPTRLAALSGLDRVIYYSSFCKALSPALRMGYVAADPALLKVLLRQKIYSVLTTPALNELVMLEVLAAGRWRKHLERLQRRLASARHASEKALASAGIRFDHPGAGGLFLWGEVPEGVDVDLLVQDAMRNKILLVRGAAFMADGNADPHIRFNVAMCQASAVADYLKERLGAVSAARQAVLHAARPLE